MAEHLLWTGLPTAIALVIVVEMSRRWPTRKTTTTVRNFSVLALLAVALVLWLSATAVVTPVRCRNNPLEWCEYNSSVPAIAVTTVGFVLIALGRAWVIYDRR